MEDSRGIECNAQRDDDEFLELFRAQAALAPQDFWSRYLYDISPSRHWKKWKNGRALDNYVGRIVDKRIAHGPATAPVDEKSKYFAIDDAIAIGLNNKSISGDAKASINKDTREMLIASVKTLIFAGHDTSASTLCVSLNYTIPSSTIANLSLSIHTQHLERALIFLSGFEKNMKPSLAKTPQERPLCSERVQHSLTVSITLWQ
ncbi:hypothetical protein Plec18170_001772 [Paecilomyces lecythidis]